MYGIWKLLSFVVRHPLNRGRPLSALSRVVRWQIGARLLPFASAVPFIDGTRLLVSRGMTGATGNWYCGLHEMHEMGFVLHALRSDELFLDVGANIGSYTVLAAGAVGADVIAVEPVPVSFERLCQNVRLNDLERRVVCLDLGLGQVEDELRFTSSKDTMNHVSTDVADIDSVVVRVVPLDTLCAERVPAMMKIDVEGYEAAVIAGGARTLASPQLQAVVMETNGSGRRYGWDDEQVIGKMIDFGFQVCTYDPIARRLERSPGGSSNTIFVRDLEAVQTRVENAPRFRLVTGTI